MPKTFTAQFSDLSGPTNPTGILSPAFLTLKLALDRGDTPDNVLQALYDWLSQKKIEPAQLDKILDLSSPEAASDALVGLIGGKLKPQELPPVVQQTLRRTIRRLAQKHVEHHQRELDVAQQRLASVQQRFRDESAPEIVRHLLQ